MSDRKLGERIKKLRGNMTLKEFSQKCNTPYNLTRYLDRGVGFSLRMPIEERRDILRRITSACGVSEDYLLVDDESEESKSSEIIIEKCAEKIRAAKSREDLSRINYFCLAAVRSAILLIAGKKHLEREDAAALRKLANVCCYILDPCIDNEWQIDPMAAINKDSEEKSSQIKN